MPVKEQWTDCAVGGGGGEWGLGGPLTGGGKN